MNSDNAPIKGVPTNIITGFLGVGKTSVILNLMKNKPSNERWAVLVNEFGEIGVDGSLFSGQQSTQQQVFIREVPGGCMCCGTADANCLKPTAVRGQAGSSFDRAHRAWSS